MDSRLVSCLFSSIIKPHPKKSTLVLQRKIYRSSQPYMSSEVGDASHRSSGSIGLVSELSEQCLMLKNEEYSKAGLRKELMPKHVALMLDGSRRWLKEKGKSLDYEPFFQANALFAELCLKWGVGTASTQICSINNLKRGKEANDLILGQFERFLDDNMENFIRKKVRMWMIGERELLPESLQNKIKQVEEETKCWETEAQLELMMAVCYAGTRDIVEAAKRLCEKAKAGTIDPNAIDEGLFDQELSTRGHPPPDLLIRTGGCLRQSDYLTWQFAQTEFYFTDIYGPDFTEVEFLQALRSFQQRVRRFGM